ncbi:MAG: TonB-dependent receptor, partial [Betaproteobacteria bacterium]
MFQHKKISLAVAQALSLGIAATMGVSAIAQTPASTEKTIITGSNIKKVLEEQTLPVVVISKEDIQKSGIINVEQLIQSITASSTSGGTTTAALTGTATYGISSASLRGLGASRTLVLLNGRRITAFSNQSSSGGGVDLNAIPLAAIERVEILTDGASSIYGSDAEAGVINFITRSDFKGIEATVEYGQPTRSGGGSVEKYSAALGFGSLKDDRYNFMFAWSRTNEEQLKATDREFSKTGNVPPFLASSATPSGRIEGVFIPGQSLSQNAASATNPLGTSTTGYGNPGRDQPGGCESFNMFPVAAKPRAPSTGRNCNFDSNPFVDTVPNSRNTNIFSTFAFQLTPQTQFFAEGLWSQHTVTQRIQPNPVRIAFLATDDAFAGSGVDQALLIFPGNPNYPSAWLQSHGLAAMDGQPLAVSARTFLTGLRTEQDTNTQRRVVAGFRGNFKNWDWEVAASHDSNSSDGTVINGFFSQLGLARVINSLGNTPGSYWNPWSVTQNATLSTALQGILYVGPTSTADLTTNALEFKANGTLMEMANGPLALAVGGGVRKEKFELIVPPILGLGDIAGLGGATLGVDEKRTTSSGYAELNIPILKTLEANLSGRVDHYDDLKSDQTPVTGKASFAWKPTKSLLIRGSAGNGFRAPTMGELYTPITVGTSEQFVDPAFPDDGPVQANSIIGGSRDLKPEKSKQFSIGVAFAPTRTLSGHVDYWKIKIDNFIVSPSALAQVIAHDAGGILVRPGEVIRADDGTVDTVTQIAANAASADFAGFDLGGHYSDSFGFGKLGVDYNATYYTKADLTWPNGLVEHNIGALVDSAGNTLTLPGNGVLFRYKHNLAFNWSNDSWGATIVQNYWTGYRTGDNQVDGAPHTVGSFTTYDLQGQYTGFKNIKLAVGVRNVLDKDPHLVVPTANYFQAGFDPSVYDPR